ncbi:DoxX family protein [Paenibacillus solisilvae]|uniref:DoxX family protein n=1 Tax=Paenibacillus solisilvae TaxID=2486751 RepID=A0ABW0VT88_9BACL
MHILSVILQSILGIGFLLFGLMKFGSKQMVDEFKRYRLSSAMRIFTGLVEVVAAAIVIIGIWIDPYNVVGAILIAVTMFFAVLVHLIRVKDPAAKVLMPFILFVMALIIISLNWNTL